MDTADLRLDHLLELADEAVDRGAWDEVLVHASAALELDPDSAEAQGLTALARRRSRRAEALADDVFQAERRTLTVMFCDLVGSTELADRNDPEVTRSVLQWYHALVGETVERYGGFVAHYMGDGALVYFGWPLAIHDSALCAVRSAVDLLRGLDRERDAVSARTGSELELRVGVHTGLVVVGEMGAGRRRERDDVVGDTPNIAARLEGLAAPGTVAVSGDTYALVQHRVSASALGPKMLKGIARPIEVYRVDDVIDSPTRFAVGRTRSPIVGRTAETARLLQVAERIEATRHGEFLGISGEPGVGKSRLLDTFLSRLGNEATIVRAQCDQFLTSTAFHPLVEAVRHRGPRTEHTEVSRVLPDHFDAFEVDDDVRESLLAGIVERLVAPLGGGPVIIAVEDVHWADPSTLDVLQRLAGGLEANRAMLVVTYRPEQVPGWMTSSPTIALNPLERAEFDDLVACLAGDDDVSDGMLERLFDRTGGVPLFVEELLSSILETSGEGDPADPDIPASLNDVLVTRLDRCGHAKRTAQIASVVGRSAPLDLLQKMMGSSDLPAHVDILVRAGVLERVGNDEVRFRHALVQDAAYSTMLRSTARTVHERAAAAITELRPASVVEAPEIVARHLQRAGRYREALALYRAAASQSIERSAPHETAAHLSGAWGCVQQLGDEIDQGTQLEILLQLGPALIAARGYGSHDVQHTYELAAKLTEHAPDSAEAFGALLGMTAFFLVNSQLDRAESLATSTHDHALRSRDPEQVPTSEAWLGTVLFFRGRFVKAARLLAAATDAFELEDQDRRAKRAGLDPGILALSHLTWMHWIEGDIAGAERRRTEMVDTATRLDAPLGYAHSLNYAAGLALLMGDDTEALRITALERSVAEDAKLPHYAAYAQVLSAAAMRRSHPAEAAKTLRAGLRQRRETGARLAIAFHHALLAEIELDAGHVDEALQAIDEAQRLANVLHERWWLPEIERLAGETHLRLNDADRAAGHFERSLAIGLDMGARFLVVRTRLSLGNMLLRSGRRLEARHQLELVDASTLGRLPELAQLEHLLALTD